MGEARRDGAMVSGLHFDIKISLARRGIIPYHEPGETRPRFATWTATGGGVIGRFISRAGVRAGLW